MLKRLIRTLAITTLLAGGLYGESPVVLEQTIDLSRMGETQDPTYGESAIGFLDNRLLAVNVAIRQEMHQRALVGFVHVWDAATGEHSKSAEMPSNIKWDHFHVAGGRVICQTTDTVHIFDTGLNPVGTIKRSGKSYDPLRISPDQSVLAVPQSEAYEVYRLWDLTLISVIPSKSDASGEPIFFVIGRDGYLELRGLKATPSPASTVTMAFVKWDKTRTELSPNERAKCDPAPHFIGPDLFHHWCDSFVRTTSGDKRYRLKLSSGFDRRSVAAERPLYAHVTQYCSFWSGLVSLGKCEYDRADISLYSTSNGTKLFSNKWKTMNRVDVALSPDGRRMALKDGPMISIYRIRER